MQKHIIFSVFVLAACAAPEATQVVTSDSAGVTIVVSEGSAPARWTSGHQLLELGSVGEGPDEFHLIRGIAKLPSGELLVANAGSDELRFFDASGAHVRTVGGRGNGPGELSGLATAVLLGDSIATHDYRNDRISIFDMAGAYARSFRLEWSGGLLGPEAIVAGVGVLSSRGTHMVDLEHDGVNVDTATVSLHDLEGNLVADLVRLPHNARFVRREGDRQTTLGVPLTSHAAFAADPGGFCYAYGPRPEVQCFDWDGSLRRILRLGEEPRVVADHHRAWYEDQFRDRPDGESPAMQTMLAAMPYPDLLPGFDRLMFTPGGQLWARRFGIEEHGVEHWVVFGRDGAVQAAFEGREGLEVMGVAGDQIVARVLDDFDVEHVVILTLTSA